MIGSLKHITELMEPDDETEWFVHRSKKNPGGFAQRRIPSKVIEIRYRGRIVFV